MNKESNRPHGHVSSAAIAASVRAFLAQHGEPAALSHFGLSRIAIVRAAAGLAVQAGTYRLLEDGLRRAPEKSEGGER